MSAVPNVNQLPDYLKLNHAFQQIRNNVRTTPLLKSDVLSELISGEVLIKAESLQITGAFKFRGAFYRLLNLTDSQKKQGVTAYSSGNFAAGLSAAGQLLDIPVRLVMPHDAPNQKSIMPDVTAQRSLSANAINRPGRKLPALWPGK